MVRNWSQNLILQEHCRAWNVIQPILLHFLNAEIFLFQTDTVKCTEIITADCNQKGIKWLSRLPKEVCDIAVSWTLLSVLMTRSCYFKIYCYYFLEWKCSSLVLLCAWLTLVRHTWTGKQMSFSLNPLHYVKLWWNVMPKYSWDLQQFLKSVWVSLTLLYQHVLVCSLAEQMCQLWELTAVLTCLREFYVR